MTGVLVPYGDVERLADALVTVLTDAGARTRYAAAGIDWAARFTWPACARASLDHLIGAGGWD